MGTTCAIMVSGGLMNRVEHVERYLRARLAVEQPRRPMPEDGDGHPFVTISRQAGTGGHALADMLLEVFAEESDAELFTDWQVYDRTVCEIVAHDPRFAPSLDSLLEEEYRSRANDFFHQVLRSTVDQNMVMDRVFLVVRTIARMGKAIIVGRAGAQVTRGMPEGVRIRMMAPEEDRIDRAMREHGLSERAARSGGRKRDADRARLVRAHFDVDIADPGGYDATFNAGSLSHRDIACAVARLVEQRAHEASAVPRQR